MTEEEVAQARKLGCTCVYVLKAVTFTAALTDYFSTVSYHRYESNDCPFHNKKVNQ